MTSSHNNGPPPINYSTHPRRCQPPSLETAPQPPSRRETAPQPLSCCETAPQPPSRSSHWYIYDNLPALPRHTLVGAHSAASPGASAASRRETAPQPPSRRETAPQPPSRSSHWYIYDNLPALPRHTLVGAHSAASPGASAAPEAPLDGLADALEGLTIGARHAALTTPAAPAHGANPAPSSPSPVTRALPVPFAHVTPGRKTQKKFYSVTIGKCCGVFSNWNFVTTLVSGVSGSSFIGFKSYQDAIENYHEAKARGCVRVEREPGDEAKFGPLSQAIM